MSKDKEYSDQYLIDKLIEFYNMYGKVPAARDLSHTPGYPTSEVYRFRFGSHKEALKLAGLYDLRKDKKLFERHKYTKEEVLKLLKDYFKIHGISTMHDIMLDPDMPTSNVFQRLFGTYNNAVRELGYEPLYEYNEYTNEELIAILRNLYSKFGRIINSRDINKIVDSKTYIYRFGSLYDAFDMAGIPYKRRLRSVPTEEIIQYWYKLKESLGHIPTLGEINDSEWNIAPAFSTQAKRWKSYSDFLHSIGEDTNYNRYGCKPKFSKKGTKCLSVCELKITDWLEGNNIQFEKEVPYKDIMPDDNTNRTFDWVINHNGQQYCVEMFGINGNDTYDEHKRQKIKDCNEHNIKLIKLNSNDAKKDLNKVFSFLFKNNDSNSVLGAS